MARKLREKKRLPARLPSVPDRDSAPTRYDEPAIARKEDRLPASRFQPGDSRADLRLRVERLLQRKEAASVDVWNELGTGARSLLVDMLDDQAIRAHDAMLHRVIGAIGRLGIQRGIAPLSAILTDGAANAVTRASAANALGRIGESAALDALLAGVSEDDDMVRRQVAMAIGRIDRESVVPHLVELARDSSPAVAEVAAAAIGRWEARLGRGLGARKTVKGGKAPRARARARRKKMPTADV